MNLRTKTFTLTKSDLNQVMLVKKYSPTRIVFSFILLIALIFLLMSGNSNSLIIIILLALFLFFSALEVVTIRRFISDPENKNFFVPRFHEASDDGLSATFESGTTSMNRFEDILKIEKWKNYYLIYFSKIILWVIPVSAFESSNEGKQFYEFVLSKGVKIHSAKEEKKGSFKIILIWFFLALAFMFILDWLKK